MQMLKMHIYFQRQTILTCREAMLLQTLFYYKPAVIKYTEKFPTVAIHTALSGYQPNLQCCTLQCHIYLKGSDRSCSMKLSLHEMLFTLSEHNAIIDITVYKTPAQMF